MLEQIDMWGNVVEQSCPKSITDKEKRKWENGFQKWSNEQFDNDGSPEGKCGYGSMCDYCEDNTYGRPCVRALNEMMREKNIKINYEVQTYSDAWEGYFDGKVY